MKELKDALRKVNTRKALGSDGIIGEIQSSTPKDF